MDNQVSGDASGETDSYFSSYLMFLFWLLYYRLQNYRCFYFLLQLCVLHDFSASSDPSASYPVL